MSKIKIAKWLITLSVIFLCTPYCVADVLSVGILGRSPGGYDPGNYYEQVLVHALEKTRSTDGDYEIKHVPHIASTNRVRAKLVTNSGLDIMWGSATEDRKKSMRYIDVDLLRGLNNYRALIIRVNDLERLKQIKNLNELKKLKVGNGFNWTDTKILRNNGFQVVTAVDYGLLIKMLIAGRFDLITRGVHEVGTDMEGFGALGIAVLPSPMLRYTHPIKYGFFVRKENEKLAKRLEQGIKLLSEDGTLERLFNQVDVFKYGQNLLQNNSLFMEINNVE